MSTFVNTVESVGDEALTASIIDKSITELADNILTSIGPSAFRVCKALTSVNFVNVSSVKTAGFYQCTALAKAEFHSFVAFGTNAFYGCSKLTALILRSPDQLCTCSSSFSSSAIANGTGYIYVPSALVDQYKAASGWSTYADQIRAIEDYPYINDPYTWDAVFHAIDDGVYTSFYAVGDLVPLDLGSEGMVNMQIAAFDADDLADGSGKAPISWISKELLATKHRMNPELVKLEDGTYQEGTGTIGGWEKCEMRSYLNDTVKPLIPEEVRNRIVFITKTHIADDTSETNYTQETTDDVWIPGTSELVGASSLYFDLFENKSSKCVKYHVGDSSASYWQTRACNYNHTFTKFTSAGKTTNTGKVTSEYAFPLGFCT